MIRNEVRPDVLEFLEQFGAAGRSSDADAQRECWAETFLSLDPVRALPVQREAMLAALPRRRELFESIGATTSELIEAEETPLDDLHTLVSTAWRWRLTSADGADDELVMKSTFLLRREGSAWTVLVYLNHQDVGAAIMAHAARLQGKD